MSAWEYRSTVTGMKSVIGKACNWALKCYLSTCWLYCRGRGMPGEGDTEGHMRAYFFHTVGKLDWPFSLGVRMRILSCWLANRSHHLPSTRVCGRTNTTATWTGTCICKSSSYERVWTSIQRLVEGVRSNFPCCFTQHVFLTCCF